MKLVKSLLLGSAAGLCAVAGAQAADLPARRAAPVEYVRVCTAYGAGFFYIPGTDTCIRVGGRARFEYNFTSQGKNLTPNNVSGSVGSLVNGDLSGFRGLGRLNLDSRTQTAYGTLRAFVRFDIATQSGGYITSGTAQRFATAFPALGQDTFGRLQTFVNVDKAFVQFAGITAGKANSFFDFYAHDLEFITATSGSDVQSTTLLAYTFTFGQGFSATISAEDPVQRRQPIFANLVQANSAFSASTGANFTNVIGTFFAVVPVPGFIPGAAGARGEVAFLDVQQRERLPDFVGALRYDAPWGAAQVSAAVHEIYLGTFGGGFANTTAVGTNGLIGLFTTAATVPVAIPRPSAEYGFAVQGGVKINLPQLAAGDVLWLQAAYSEGGLSYTGIPLRFSGSENSTNTLSRFALNSTDAYIGADGRTHLTESFSVTAAFLHYFTPEVRGALFGSYSEVYFGAAARGAINPLSFSGVAGTSALVNAPAGTAPAFNSLLKDYSVATVGANLIWSPVRDLDIGVETIYQRVELLRGRAVDGSIGAFGATSALGIPNAKLVKDDDVFQTRVRVQRDF